MEHISFTDEEKRVVTRILFREPRKSTSMFVYVVGISPSLLMAAYSIWVQDFRATLIAYLALLAVMIWYLSDAQSSSHPLWSAINKYEAVAGALRKSDQQSE